MNGQRAAERTTGRAMSRVVGLGAILSLAVAAVSGASARVEIRYIPEGVEVEVTDAGGGPNGHVRTVPGAGQGLVGIAERAALFGGRAEAGPTREGGFRVRAWLAEDRVLV